MDKKNLISDFNWMYENIPAYKKFINERGLTPSNVKTPDDIPIMTKENYIEKYNIWERLNPQRPAIAFASSCGTTKEPTFWPVDDFAIEHIKDSIKLGMKYFNSKNILCCETNDSPRALGVVSTRFALERLTPQIAKLHVSTRDLIGLERLLENSNFDWLLILCWPDAVEQQAEILKNFNLPKNVVWYVIGGSVPIETQRAIAKKVRGTTILSGYQAADTGGIIGWCGNVFAGELVYSDSIKVNIEKKYDPMKATVFVPFPDMAIDQMSNRLILSTLSRGHPLLKYDIGDIGGKVEDIDFPVPLYWTIGKSLNKIRQCNVGIDLIPVKEFVAQKLRLKSPDEVFIWKYKTEWTYPNWFIRLKDLKGYKKGQFEEEILEFIIQGNEEVKNAIKNGEVKNHFKPAIEITE